MMAKPERDVRIKKYLPLGLSVLALAGALWWALAGLRDTEPGKDAGSPVAALPPPPSDGAARPEDEGPALRSPPPPPIREGRGKPGSPPPERIVPETEPVEPERRALPSRPAAHLLDAGEPEEEPKPAPEFFNGAQPRTLLGGVARTSARATQEVLVAEGRGVIGTPLRWIEGLEGARGVETYQGLRLEVPRHHVEMYAYYMDRFEVSNHRYWEYLENSARILYDTSDFEPRTLIEIAKELVAPYPDNLDIANVTARQLYEANKAALLAVFEDSIVTVDGVVDEESTWARVRERPVPSGLRLTFFDRAPPGTWPSDRYDQREIDHPVRDVSLEEALAYAQWAGRHIPTELEWEYAARGPKGLDFPWGPAGLDFPQRVNGGSSLKRGEVPRTSSIFHYPGGVSWVGCFNLLGNVSEWTSSWTDFYPGGSVQPGFPEGRFLVVRGGSAADLDRYLLRPAFRGWSAAEPEGAPRPNRRRPWTGFRTARHVHEGFDLLPAVQYFARRGGQLDAGALDARGFAAWQGRLVLRRERYFDPYEVDVRPGHKAFVVQAFPSIALPDGGRRPWAVNREHGMRDDQALLQGSARQPILLGLLRNDFPLVNTWSNREENAPALERVAHYGRADCPAGVWFICVLHRQLALLSPDFGRAFYVTTRGLPAALLTVIEQKRRTPRSRPPRQATILLDADAGVVDVRLTVPLGEREGLLPFFLEARVRLEADAAELVRVEGWHETDPARVR